jgi:hypothetical protein
MTNNSKPYKQTVSLPINIYLLFYLYVFLIFIIANVLPVSTGDYFLFLFLGILGLSILLIKFTYSISIDINSGVLSITIPFKIALLKLKIKDIETIDQIIIDHDDYDDYGLKKSQACNAYVFNKGAGIKLVTKNRKVFIFSCSKPAEIVNYINKLTDNKEQIKGRVF